MEKTYSKQDIHQLTEHILTNSCISNTEFEQKFIDFYQYCLTTPAILEDKDLCYELFVQIIILNDYDISFCLRMLIDTLKHTLIMDLFNGNISCNIDKPTNLVADILDNDLPTPVVDASVNTYIDINGVEVIDLREYYFKQDLKFAPCDNPNLHYPESGFGEMFFDDEDRFPGHLIRVHCVIDKDGNVKDIIGIPREKNSGSYRTASDYDALYSGLMGQIMEYQKGTTTD